MRQKRSARTAFGEKVGTCFLSYESNCSCAKRVCRPLMVRRKRQRSLRRLRMAPLGLLYGRMQRRRPDAAKRFIASTGEWPRKKPRWDFRDATTQKRMKSLRSGYT